MNYSDKLKTKSKVSKRRNVGLAVINIYVTFNNTIVTITDTQGNPIATSSAGTNKFKGSRKPSPHAAQVTVEDACKKASDFGVKTVSIRIRGIGPQREGALRAVFGQGFIVTSVTDVSTVAHNGVKPRKRRRV